MTADSSESAGPPNDPELFQRVNTILDAAIDLPPGERSAYVRDASGGDDRLRVAVEGLLRAHDQAGDFLAGTADSDGMLARALASEDSNIAPDAVGAASDTALQDRLQRALGDRYRVEDLVARGGMATVYRAFDPRHGRSVAVKALDARLAALIDADGGSERFLSEIRVTAGLQHPHILPLFDSGAVEGLLYYVMPFVDGETVRQRLRRESPLPVDEAVRIAATVASALAHAHARGVVHRDLKPENILLQDGQPIVADFGIALAARQAAGPRATQTGLALGTPRYMAPEQAYGDRPIDERSDIYALGAVTYEMLTGEPPHLATTAQALLAKRQTERPTPIRVLRPAVPEHVDRAVQRALEIIPADRFGHVAEFATALASPGQASGQWDRPNDVVKAGSSRRWLVAVGLVGVLGVGALATWAAGRGQTTPAAATRFLIAPDPDAAVSRPPTITPDGSRFVYPGAGAKGRRLYVRRVNELTARAVPGTDGALSAFVSPDGKWVAFLTDQDRFKKVSLDGGPVTELGAGFRYGAGWWAHGDRIVLAQGLRSLTWVSADGGVVHPLSQFDAAARETRHSQPIVLDDGRTVIFTVERDRSGPIASDGELAVTTLDTAATTIARHTLLGVKARMAVAVIDDWLLYAAPNGRALMAVRFDARARRVSGQSITVLEDSVAPFRSISLSRNGTLLYTRGGPATMPLRVDSLGSAMPLFPGVRGAFMNPRFSPDGRRLAIQGESPQGTDVWIYDVASGTPTQFTSVGSAIGPTWTPDGRRIVYLSAEGGQMGFWSQPADASTPARRIVGGDGMFAVQVAPDNRTIVFQQQSAGAWGIWAASLDGDARVHPVVVDRFDAYMPAISPDGKWLAYAANSSGRYEIYVRPFPGPGAAVQISADGGVEPAWTRDGTTVLFRGDRRMYAATLSAGPNRAVTRRVALFNDGFDDDMPMPHRNFDIAPDGHHYVMIGSARDEPVQTIVVLDWLGEFRQAIRSR
jgi:serine/threonine-protein kinase